MASSTLATTWAARGRCALVRRLCLEQLGMRQDHPELVVQPVEQHVAVPAAPEAHGRAVRAGRGGPSTPGLPWLAAGVDTGAVSGQPPAVGLAPQRVGEDPDGSAGRSHVFNLAAESSCKWCGG